MFCRVCGQKVHEQAVICPECGVETGVARQGDYGQKADRGAVRASYIVALLVPLLGLVMAVYLLFKERLPHAVAVAVLSVFTASFWYSFVDGFLRGYS